MYLKIVFVSNIIERIKNLLILSWNFFVYSRILFSLRFKKCIFYFLGFNSFLIVGIDIILIVDENGRVLIYLENWYVRLIG